MIDRVVFALAAAALLGMATCSAEGGEPPVPSEEELVESAATICELRDTCAEEEEDPGDFDVCVGQVRNDVVGEILLCDWKWIELNECIVGLSCEDYAEYDAHMVEGCGEEYQGWQDCRRQ